jgi:hypothetical protein
MGAVQAWKAAVQQLQELERQRQRVLANPNNTAATDSMHAVALQINSTGLTAVCSDAACKEIVVNLKVGWLAQCFVLQRWCEMRPT